VQQSQPELLPQYGHTHLQSSMNSPHLSQRGSSFSSVGIQSPLLQLIVVGLRIKLSEKLAVMVCDPPRQAIDKHKALTGSGQETLTNAKAYLVKKS
jgi:hypothetical protein